MRTCSFCGHPRADGIQTHAWDCEWCTLVQRIGRIEAILKDQHGSSKEPHTGGTTGLGYDWARPVSEFERAHCSDAVAARLARTNTGPAEPAGAEAAGAEPRGTEPERAD